MTGSRPMRVAFLLVLTVAMLAGCGPMPETVPPTAPATAPASADGTATPGTPATALLTLGDLATRINAAWRNVSSYQITFTGPSMAAPSPPGTPVATPVATPGATPVARSRGSLVFVREVVLPDQQRQEVSGLGPNDHEAIVVGEEIFIRGPLVEQIAPGTADDTWISVDPARIPEGSQLSSLLAGLPAPPPAPLASLPQRLWPQQLRDLGEVEFDGRACQVYGAADTAPATGMRIDYAIAVDDQNIPCFIETSAGGVTQGRDEYRDIGGDFAITAPNLATPVSVPPALATPAIRD